jgi:microcystin-dependent protein
VTSPMTAAPALATMNIYGSAENKERVVEMAKGIVGVTGEGAPHENRQPLLAVRFIIALRGIFPQRP